MGEIYSDRRWWDAPRGITSECGDCKYHLGFGKCEKYPEGIPKDLMKKSFPNTKEYKKKYCKYRRTN